MGYDKLVDSEKLDATFSDIANAIKLKTIWNNSTRDQFDNGKYIGAERYTDSEMADKIRAIDKFRPMTIYPNGLDNGYVGNMVVRVAASYFLARKRYDDRYKIDASGDVSGAEDFDYNSDTNPFNAVQSTTNENYMKAVVRDKLGRGVLDCSSFVGFVLRGIPYENSPFIKYPNEGKEVRWEPRKELSEMYGENKWEYTVLDKQPGGEFRNLLFDTCSTVRSAGELAEFFMKYGYVVYDKKREGGIPADLIDRLQPGDLLFFEYEDADKAVEYNKTSNRFRGIHHIGIVAEREERYYHVTGSDKQNKVTLVDGEYRLDYDVDGDGKIETGEYIKAEDGYFDLDQDEKYTSEKDAKIDESCVAYNYVLESSGLCLVCRPNYLLNGLTGEVPIGANLLSFPWAWGTTALYDDIDSLTCEAVDMNKLKLNFDTTATTSFSLAGAVGNKYSCIKLPKGKYKLSGMNGSGITSTAFAIQLKDINNNEMKDDNGDNIRCYDGKEPTFTINEETYVRLLFYIGANRQVTNFEFTPKLERIK